MYHISYASSVCSIYIAVYFMFIPVYSLHIPTYLKCILVHYMYIPAYFCIFLHNLILFHDVTGFGQNGRGHDG